MSRLSRRVSIDPCASCPGRRRRHRTLGRTLLAFLPAYPFWALAMFTVDMLIIYGLAVYGGQKLREA